MGCVRVGGDVRARARVEDLEASRDEGLVAFQVRLDLRVEASELVEGSREYEARWVRVPNLILDHGDEIHLAGSGSRHTLGDGVMRAPWRRGTRRSAVDTHVLSRVEVPFPWHVNIHHNVPWSHGEVVLWCRWVVVLRRHTRGVRLVHTRAVYRVVTLISMSIDVVRHPLESSIVCVLEIQLKIECHVEIGGDTVAIIAVRRGIRIAYGTVVSGFIVELHIFAVYQVPIVEKYRVGSAPG